MSALRDVGVSPFVGRQAELDACAAVFAAANKGGVGPAIAASAGSPQMIPPKISTTPSGLPTASQFPLTAGRVSPLIGTSSIPPYDPTRQWGAGISF